MELLEEEKYTPIDFDFKSWVLKQTSSEYAIHRTDENHIQLESSYGLAAINFYPQGLVEISITAKKDGSDRFYLHFQLNDEEHARQLFSEMQQALIGLKNERTTRILLACSAGLTTSYFAQKLNEAAKSLEIDYEFDAVSYLDLFMAAPGYDAILIAPQIGYMHQKLAAAVPDKPVFLIPTAIFASYDAFKAIEFVRSSLTDFHHEKGEKEKSCSECALKGKRKVLAIAALRDYHHTRIFYRLYDHGQIALDEAHIKPEFCIKDFTDVIDTVLCRHKDLDQIILCMPGVIVDNRFVQARYQQGSEFGDIPETPKGYAAADYIQGRYGVPVQLISSAKATVYGYAQEHPEYQTILYHTQGYGMPIGGQAYMCNGQLLDCPAGINGEVKFYLSRLQFSDELKNLAKTAEGMSEIVSKALLAPLTVLTPDVVVIRSLMTSDMNDIRRRVASFIPESALPEFVYLPEAQDYMLAGALHFGLEKDLEAGAAQPV